MNTPIRLLLIDDDEDDYIITRDLLDEIEGKQYHLDWISDYNAAKKAIKQQAHDVYLVDYRLSSGTGLELLLEAKESGCEAPIIFLTGQGDRQIDMKAMEAGAADYLVKGQINALLLERSIRYAIQRWKMKQAIGKAEKLKTAQELAGTVCHEFSQPLQILSLSSMMLKDNPGEINHIETSQQMIDRITDLVHKLRNITEVKSQPYLDMQIVDLNASTENSEHSIKTY